MNEKDFNKSIVRFIKINKKMKDLENSFILKNRYLIIATIIMFLYMFHVR